MRWPKRKKLLENLVPKYKKKDLDIAELPAILDEIKQLPKDVSAETTLSGSVLMDYVSTSSQGILQKD